MYFCFQSLLLRQPTAENLWITKSATKEILDPQNNQKNHNLNSQNTLEKFFWTHKIPTKTFLEPREKILDPRNTNEKKIWTHEIPTKVRWHNGTYETHDGM